MPKLFEILAVEADSEKRSKAILDEQINTLRNKVQRFTGVIKKYEPLEDLPENQLPTEQRQISTSVNRTLDYLFDRLGDTADIAFQKEATNQLAKADVIVEGQVLLKDAPATFLLNMEKRLKQWREALFVIPTLPPGIKWEKDPVLPKDVYVTAHPEESIRTIKVPRAEVLVPVSHPKEGERGNSVPAQIKEWSETVTVGKYVTTHYSALITSSEKADILDRCDKLIAAVKKARQRANTCEIVDKKVSKEMVNYILKGF